MAGCSSNNYMMEQESFRISSKNQTNPQPVPVSTQRAMKDPELKKRLARCSCSKNANTVVFESNMRQTMSNIEGLKLL